MRDVILNTAPSGPPRVGIVGAGLMGWWHAHTVKKIGGRIVGVADPIADRSQKIADKFGADPYASVEDMLNDGDIDILHICTTTTTHDTIVRQALRHNAHVFVEKPLASTVAQTRALNALALKSGKALCPVHQYAFQRSVETILEQRDRAGVATHIDLKFFSAGADGVAPADYSLFAADILPHPASILQRLFPDISLAGIDWKIATSERAGWEISAAIEGVFVRVSISHRTRPTCAALTLRGDQGSFVADLFHDYVLFRNGTVSRRSKMQRPLLDAVGHLSHASANIVGRMVRREPAYPGLQTLTRRFHKACAGDGPQPISANQIIDAAEIRDRFLDRVMPPSERGLRQ